MKEHISETLLLKLSECVSEKIGLYYRENKLKDLLKGIKDYSKEFNFQDTNSCIEWFLSPCAEKKHFASLARHLTIGETYFFREKISFDILQYQILPVIMSKRKKKRKYLRFWSAGCSTGEEPYSIAIMVSEMLSDLKDWDIKILSTDINMDSLKKASDGIYTDWSFRDTPLWVKNNYFKKTKENFFEINQEIKDMVNFTYLNLAEDIYPSILTGTIDMDIIFCRNVLMYFSSEIAKNVLKGFYHSLVDGGWLLINPSESIYINNSDFTQVNFKGAILYKKENNISSKSFYFTELNLQNEDIFPYEPLPSEDFKITDCQIKTEKNYEEIKIEELEKLYKLGLYDEGEDKIKKALLKNENFPGAGKAMILLSRIYANQKKFSSAEEWCRKAILSDRLKPDYYYFLATIFQEENKIEEAKNSLKKALYVDHNFALAHFALGNLFLKELKRNEAKRYFNNTLSILKNLEGKKILEEIDGITVERLRQIIETLKRQ